MKRRAFEPARVVAALREHGKELELVHREVRRASKLGDVSKERIAEAAKAVLLLRFHGSGAPEVFRICSFFF